MFLSLFIVASGCKTAQESASTEQNSQESLRYKMQVQFASAEAVKRVPLRYENLRMQLDREILLDQHLYLVSIACRAYEIDGIVRKLKLDEEIVDIRRVE